MTSRKSTRPNRRQFICGCSAAVAAFAGSRFNTVAFGDPNTNQDHLVVLFLRGGFDALNAFPPIAGTDRGHYEVARPSLQVPLTGPDSALPLAGGFGISRAGEPLIEIYQDGGLALVQGVGMADVNRSHFDAMQLIELGASLADAHNTGWITRHLESASNIPAGAQMPSLAIGGLQPTSQAGHYETVNFAYPDYFNIYTGGGEEYNAAQRAALLAMYQQHESWLHSSGAQAISAMELVENNLVGDYTPINGAVYPNTEFGTQIRMVAQLIKLGVGLQVATVDIGGFDTHENQGVGNGSFFEDLWGELAQGLAAFYKDLDTGGSGNALNRTTVVVMSEFGREIRENSDGGTEHGYGSTMMVMGGAVNGGMHGTWPGLAPGARVDGTDIGVTVDFRQVLSEVLIRRMCNPQLGQIFPGYSGYQPLGVVQGSDLPVDSEGALFTDGFEAGNVSAWSQSIG